MFSDLMSRLGQLILSKKRYRIIVGLVLIFGAVAIFGVAFVRGAQPLRIINDLVGFVQIVLPILLGLALALVEPPGNLNRKQREIAKDEKEILRNKSSNLDEIFHIFRLRMLFDSDRLKFNSNKNLAIGIIFSFFALSLLSYFVLLQPSQIGANFVDFALQWYLPRTTIVLLLQFVGFFFLRLYVASELDIKHNKNEITNIEAQIMAYSMAKEFGIDAAKPVIDALAKTERNFIVKKDEKTISTENLSEYNDMKGFVDKLLDKLPSKPA